VPELGKVQFEFFPAGDVNSREGWCSLRLRVPDHTRLRWSAFVGKKRIGPRTDHFDQRQWWCRYGLLWLNFCLVSEVKTEVSPETDTLLCGIEVHEILPNVVRPESDTPVEAQMPIPRDRFQIFKNGDASRANVPGTRHKGITSTGLPMASVSGNVEVQEYPSDGLDLAEGGTTQLLKGREVKGSNWRPGALSQTGQREGMLPLATPSSTTSTNVLAMSGSRSLGGSLGGTGGSLSGSTTTPKDAATKSSAVPAIAPTGKQLTRPQSVPSIASRKDKNAQRQW
jgi:hypothetical protein